MYLPKLQVMLRKNPKTQQLVWEVVVPKGWQSFPCLASIPVAPLLLWREMP